MKNWQAGVAIAGAVIILAAAYVLKGGSGGSGTPAGWPHEKPITFIIPFGPGGGFDEYVRKFAPELEKRLGTHVVPENVPGAGGRIGANTIYRAEPDGYTIGIWNIPGMGITPLLGEDVKYDIDKVTWLAQLSYEPYAIGVKTDSSIKSFNDLCNLGRPATLAVQGGLSSTATLTSLFSMAVAKCPYKLVTGYQGSAQATLGVMRGDVDARVSPIASLKPFVDSGDIRLILTYEEKSTVEGVPAAGEIGYEEFTNFSLRRMIGGPPGMPDDIVKRLSDAFVETANSPSMQQWSRKSNRPLEPLDSSDATGAMHKIMQFYRQYADMLRAELGRN